MAEKEKDKKDNDSSKTDSKAINPKEEANPPKIDSKKGAYSEGVLGTKYVTINPAELGENVLFENLRKGWLSASSLGVSGVNIMQGQNINISGSGMISGIDPVILSSNPSYMTYIRSTQDLENEITELKNDRLEMLEKLGKVEKKAAAYEKDKEKLSKLNDEIDRKLRLGYLLTQVNSDARERLLKDDGFRKLFENASECKAYIISIDIRRSTELMLKAKNPRLFEKFIVSLCRGLQGIILNNYGVFDKFTGDGILAFFPTFYSGKDAGLLAVKSSIECHKFFDGYYKENRSCFVSVLQDVGLGIGIDCGNTYLVNMGGSYTVVGQPVVYACRLSGARAGDTLLNQTAYEEVFRDYKQFLNFEEKTIEIKHEGNVLAYRVFSNGETIKFEKPEWNQPQDK